MRRSEYGPLQWSLAPPAPGTAARFRRWNIVLIAILAFLVLGVFVVAEAPHAGSRSSNTANVSMKESESTPAQHAKADKAALPGIRSRGGSGNVQTDLKNEHHAG